MQQLTSGPSVNYSKINTFDAKAFTAVGSQIEKVFTDINNERIKNQVNNATAEASFRITKLQQEMQNVDPSLADVTYQQRVGEIYKELTTGMSDDSIAKLQPTFLKLQTAARINVFNDGIKRNKAGMLGDSNDAFEKTIDSFDPKSPAVQYDIAIDQAKENTNGLVVARALNEEQASRLLNRRIDEIRITQAQNQLYANPQKLLNDLNDPSKYEGLDGSQRAAFMTRARNYIESEQNKKHNVAVQKINAATGNVLNGADPNVYKEIFDPAYIQQNIKPNEQERVLRKVAEIKDFVKTEIPALMNETSQGLTKALAEQPPLTGDPIQDKATIALQNSKRKFITAELKTRRNDLGQVLLRSDSVQANYRNFQTAIVEKQQSQGFIDNTQDAFELYKMSVMMETKRLGLPSHEARYLTNDMAKQIASNLNNGPLTDTVATLQGYAAADPSGSLLTELQIKGKLNSNLAAIAAIDDPQDATMAVQIVQRGTDNSNQFSFENVGIDKKQLNQLKENIDNSFENKFGKVGIVNGAKLVNLKRAVLLVASGTVAGGTSIPEAVDDAFKKLTPYQIFNSDKVKGIVTIEPGTDEINASTLERALVFWGEKNLPNIEYHDSVTSRVPAALDANKVIASAVIDSAIWQLDSTGTTAVLTSSDGMTNILQKNGTEITVDVDTVMRDLLSNPRGMTGVYTGGPIGFSPRQLERFKKQEEEATR